MEYNPPYGASDPNASYVDRNTAGATSGSRVPAAAVEFPQREIMAVIAAAGLAPDNADLTQLLQSINHLISMATGGGDTSNFVLMPQARTRLPIFPEVLTSDGRIPVISPSTGQVRVPAAYDFQHRGIFTITTVQTDFATAASKTYHLRWTPSGGFALRDLADAAYNPSALAETNVAFDSGYDDMLVARVVTSAGNVATITNLANKSRLTAVGESSDMLPTIWEDNKPPSQLVGSEGEIVALNWARKPMANLTGFTDVTVQYNTTQTAELNVVVQSLSRYQVRLIYQRTQNPIGGFVAYQAMA